MNLYNKAFLSIMVLPLVVSAQTLKELKFEGLERISPVVAQEMSKLEIGKRIDYKKVDESIKTFYKQGYFRDIEVFFDDGVLVYSFKEKPSIANIELKGYGENRDRDEILGELGIKKGDVFDESNLQRAKRDIVKALERKDLYDSVVESSVESINDDSIKLTLEINEGESIIIDDINYCGAKNLSASDFENSAANRERDFMGWMWGLNDGKLKVNDLDYDNLRIQDYYYKKGYLDATVSTPFLKADFNRYRATIDYKIVEGDIYRVGSVEFFIDNEVVSIDELKNLITLKSGFVFNIDRVRRDTQRLKEKIANLGYAFVNIAPDFIKNSDSGVVDVTYSISVGKKVKINDVTISGNSRTLDRVIRRDVFLAPGDIYNYTDLKDSIAKLKRSGYFEDVTIDEIRVSEDELDLLVRVSEAKTGEFKFGVGYGSYGGFSALVGVSDRNVFGSGMSAGAMIDTSSKTRTYRFSLNNPSVLDSRYSLNNSIFKSKYDAYDYTENKEGFSSTLGRFLTRHLKATLGYELTRTELTDFTDTLEDKYKKYYSDGEFLKSASTIGLAYDNTDDFYIPRSGFDISGYVEYAGIGGDEKYVKNFGNFAYYFGLLDYIDRDIILRYKARGGYLVDNGYLPINEKFYLGGIRNIRGFTSSSISPKDTNGVRVGGRVVFSNSAEVSFALFESVKMRLTAFYDYGMLGEDSLDEMSRHSAGLSLEWISPVGPLHLIFPKAIDPLEGDITSSFEFSMGQRF